MLRGKLKAVVAASAIVIMTAAFAAAHGLSPAARSTQPNTRMARDAAVHQTKRKQHAARPAAIATLPAVSPAGTGGEGSFDENSGTTMDSGDQTAIDEGSQGPDEQEDSQDDQGDPHESGDQGSQDQSANHGSQDQSGGDQSSGGDGSSGGD